MRAPISRCRRLTLVLWLLAPLSSASATPKLVFMGVVTTNALLTATYHPDGSVTNTLGDASWLGSVLMLTADGEVSRGSFTPVVSAALYWSAAQQSQTTFIWETPPLVGTAARPLVFFSATLLLGPPLPWLWVYEVVVDPDGTTSVTRGLLFLN